MSLDEIAYLPSTLKSLRNARGQDVCDYTCDNNCDNGGCDAEGDADSNGCDQN